MSLEKLLSENMIRFGTKNLVEQTKVGSTIYGTRFGTYTLQEMAGLANTYNPTNGYIAISNGNEWLANQRAKSLSVFFSKNISKILDVPYNSKAVKISEAKVLGAGAENQYVTGTLYAILEKPGKPAQEYKYSLLYKFYEVDGKPHIVVTSREGKMGAPKKISRIAAAKAFAEKYITDYMPNLPTNAKLVWQQFGGSDGNLGVMIPLPNIYSKKDGSVLYFDSQEQFDMMRNFIAKYTDITSGIPLSRSGNQSNWYSSPGGGGNYIFGKPEGAKAVILSKDGSKLPEVDKDKNQFINPETVTIRRTSSDKNTGDIDGATIDGTGTKPEIKKIGEFKFDKTMFADNMIRIQNTPELQAKIQEIKKAYDDVVSKNPEEFEVKSITSIVQGYASSDAATNRTNSGNPDHRWGINWPTEKWITK